MWLKTYYKKVTKTPMSKMLTPMAIFFALVFGIYGVKKLMFIWSMSRYEPPAITISATKATSKVWQSYLTVVSTLSAINGVDLSSDVSGIVKEIHFNSGQHVKKGALLLLIDNSVEQALLKSNQAKLQLARINYERERKLFERNVSSKATLDTRYAELLQAQGAVESIEAQIKQKTIAAPFAGRLGIRQIDLGQYLSPGAPIVTLQSMNPLYVLLNVPEQYLPGLYIHQRVDITADFGRGKTITGKVTAINSKVDPVTRNVLVQALIPNEKYELYPGMFGSAKIWFKDRQNTVVVPQTAISYSLSGDYVFIIKNEIKSKDKPLLRAYRQYVTVGDQRGTEASITKGLKPGDLIVTSGQLKLQNGTRVIVDNSVEL